MTRRIVWVLVAASLAALIYWIGSNTYWADTKIPMPPKGEAATNPFYAVQRFTEALGARSSWDRTLNVPAPDAVIVLSTWQWNLSASRRDALERWVESGGRLVVDWSLSGGEEFDRWSGISRVYREPDDEEEPGAPDDKDECAKFQEEHDQTPSLGTDTTRHWICDFDTDSFLTSTRNVRWALREASGIQAMRVDVGRGSVTVINAAPFRYRKLFDGDHGWLFVAATQLRRGDEVHFLSEDDHPSLLALLWQHGGPVVVLALTLVALALWRGAVRFGPLAPANEAARRSLADQIRGTGQFALQHGGGESLHAACVRALDDAAQRRIPGYTRLSASDRTAALERLTGFDRDALAAAIHHTRLRSSHELRNTIALLEAARRQTLVEHTRYSHGTR
jgi:hypothetical protein